MTAKRILALAAVCLLTSFLLLGERPLWDIDEGMHAVTSLEMIRSGDWITPTFNGEPFYDKPAFHNWLVALSFLAFGATELAARLPSALLGFGTALATAVVGARLFGGRAGLLAGVVLATSGLHALLSRSVVHDSSLAFFVALATLFFQSAYASERGRTRNLLLCYLACGFGVLAKGPVGAALPGLTVLGFLALRRRLAFVRDMKLQWAVPVALLVCAPWYLAISGGDPEYAFYFFVRKNVLGFLTGDTGHVEPWYFYAQETLVGMLPWSLLVPGALWCAFRARRGPRGEGLDFALAWFCTGIAFFSISSSKLGTYLLPVLPGMALLIGWLWDELVASGGVARWRAVAWPQAALALLLACCLVYALTLAPPDLIGRYGVALWQVQALVAIPATLVSAGLVALWMRRPAFAFWADAAVFGTLWLGFLLIAAETVNPYRSTGELAQRVDAELAPGEELVFLGRIKDSALFYVDRRARSIRSREDVEAYLASDRRVFLFVGRSNRDDLERLGVQAHLVAELGAVAVFSNRPGPLALPGQRAERLSVLVILADDLARSGVGERTPAIDRLAREGVSFARAHCAATLCAPSRQALLTGRWPHANGVTRLTTPLPPDSVTLGTLFRSAGYDTAAIGKMHWNQSGEDAPDFGFDVVLDRRDWRAQLSAQELERVERHRDAWTRSWNDPAQRYRGPPLALPPERTESAWLVDRTIEFLDGRGDRPFLAFCSLSPPHFPFTFPAELEDAAQPGDFAAPAIDHELQVRNVPGIDPSLPGGGSLRPEDVPPLRAAYARSSAWLDRQVGRLVAHVDASGLGARTVVVFSSDHGYLLGEHGLVGKRASYDEVVRVPLVLRIPGRRGETRDELVSQLDLLPTLTDLAGIPAYAAAQGRSLVPLLAGTAPPPGEVYAELPGEWGLLRTDEWKFVVGARRELGLDQLYDLGADPGEEHNLFGPEQEPLLQSMVARMAELLAATPPANDPDWMAQPDLLEAVRRAVGR